MERSDRHEGAGGEGYKMKAALKKMRTTCHQVQPRIAASALGEYSSNTGPHLLISGLVSGLVSEWRAWVPTQERRARIFALAIRN